MEIASRQVINLLNSDSEEDESASALNPPLPSNAFFSANSASASVQKPKRTNTVVVLSDSDNGSDIVCVTPKQKRQKFEEDPIDIDQPGPSGLNLK